MQRPSSRELVFLHVLYQAVGPLSVLELGAGSATVS